MANDKPMDAKRVVPIDIPVEFRIILRNEVEIWRDGDRSDLEAHLRAEEKLRDPVRTRRRIATYERLIAALKRGEIELPDEEVREALHEAAAAFDAEADWVENKFIHDAQRAMLAVIDGDSSRSEGGAAAAGDAAQGGEEQRTTRGDDSAMESAVLHRLLDVQGAGLTLAELIRELAGEEADFGARDAVERAARDLSGAGLIHLIDEFARPTRAALRFEELIER